jgi:hypothetical protein
MASFTDAELTFLRSARLLGRIATVATDGMPHVRDMAKSKKFRDVASTGRAEVLMEPEPLIRIYPDRVRSWGLKDTSR